MKSPMKIDFNDNILGFWCALKIVDSFECVCVVVVFFGSWLFISWLSMNFVALTTANIVTMASDHRITQPQQHTNRRRGRKKCFDECTSLARHCTCLYIFRVHANQPIFFLVVDGFALVSMRSMLTNFGINPTHEKPSSAFLSTQKFICLRPI